MMKGIDFLTVEDVLILHTDQARRYGGDVGLRDRGLLESAVAQPKAMFGGEYLHRFPFKILKWRLPICFTS